MSHVRHHEISLAWISKKRLQSTTKVTLQLTYEQRHKKALENLKNVWQLSYNVMIFRFGGGGDVTWEYDVIGFCNYLERQDNLILGFLTMGNILLHIWATFREYSAIYDWKVK